MLYFALIDANDYHHLLYNRTGIIKLSYTHLRKNHVVQCRDDQIVSLASRSETLTLPVKMSAQDIVSRAIYSILTLTNVVGNSLVILVIIRNRSMKTPLNYLILNLAVADLTVGVFLAPSLMLTPITTYPPGLTGDILCCLFRGGLAWTAFFPSVYSLVCIAFERYYAIMKPYSIRHRTTIKKLKIFIPACWIIGAILSFTNFLLMDFNKNREHFCRFKQQSPLKKVLFICWSVFNGLVPTGIMLALYSRVIRRLWFEKDANSVTFQAVRRSRKKITKIMLMLSTMYVICCLPDSVRHILEVSFPSHVSFSWASSNVFHCFLLLNSTINPFIYAFQFANLRRELMKMCCCGRQDRGIGGRHRTRDRGVEENGRVNMGMRRMDGIV